MQSTAALCCTQGRILCACEDIGRHNALDKAVGSVLLAGVPLSECVLYTSGRVPDGHGAQGHPGGRSGTGEQDHAHRSSRWSWPQEYGLQLVCGRKHPLNFSKNV